jgi:hypothetical protein
MKVAEYRGDPSLKAFASKRLGNANRTFNSFVVMASKVLKIQKMRIFGWWDR